MTATTSSDGSPPSSNASPASTTAAQTAASPTGVDITDGGIVARYPARSPRRLRIAPTVADTVNTIVLEQWPTPTGCMRLEDTRFAFDSSFLHPSVATELSRLFGLRPPGSTDGDKLAVFGHADPIGEEAYNKTLAGRRAKAVYAVLTRQPELWDDLYQNSFGGDRWGTEVLQTCLATLGYDVGAIDGEVGPLFRGATRSYKTDHGLPADEQMDRATRLALFGSYMDSLTADEGGTGRAYEAGDFVGGGTDPHLRGALQGCGERNPAMVLSQDEAQELEPDSQRPALIRAHRPNRRALVFLFRPADVASLKLWACPSATSGPDGCAAVAWSNKDERVTPTDSRREIRRSGRTFGCKFYDYIARLSPCESVRGRVRIWLLDQDHQRMPNAAYRLTIGTLVREGTASDDGLLVEEQVPLGPRAYLEWTKGVDPQAGAPAASGGPTLAFAIDASTVGGGDDSDPSHTALFRALRDGQFPSYAGLLPERKSGYGARKPVLLNAETAPAQTPDQDAQQNAARLQNLALQSTDTTSADQSFQKVYGADASIKDVHTNGTPGGGVAPTGATVQADATVAPPSCDPLEQPIVTVLGANPNRAPTHFQNDPTYEKTVDKQGDSAPPKDSYSTPLFNFQFLGQWCIPVGSDTQADGKTKVDASPKRTCTTDPCMDVRQGTSKNFGNALVHVTCKLYSAFVSDPTTTNPTPKAFADWCLIHEGHSGVRGGINDLHASGSAIDINASTNPWLPLRNATARGGERHSAGLADKHRATPAGQAVMNAYGLQNIEAAITRFNDENVWTPCCDAIDAASEAYYGTTANLADRQGGETSRACFTRLALASAALVRYLRLAYGDRGDLKQPMSKQTEHGPTKVYNQLGADQLARFAVSDVIRGYATASSDLAQLLSHVTALEDPDRTNESLVQSKIDDGVTKLSDAQRAGLADLQTKAMNAHTVLRRGMVHGSLSFFADRASADTAWKRGKVTTAPPNWTVFETTVPGVFGVVPDWRDPRVGFLNLRVELLEAFDDTSKELFGAMALDGRNQPGEPHLRWGAVDFGMGGGASGDLMHFDFNVHDPGTPADPNLAAWRGLQEERRLARVAHAKVAALVKATKPILAAATAKLADVNAKVAKVQAADLAQEITDLSTRLSAMSPGCVGKINDKVSSIDQTNGQEYDAIFGADVTDGPSAQPHRQAIEALLDPAQQAKTNATSAQQSAGALDKRAAAAVQDKKGSHHDTIKGALDKLGDDVSKLEQAVP